MNNKFDLSGKYALITGAAGLLGIEHAIALLEIGSNLILTDIDIDKLVQLKKVLSKKFSKRNILIYHMNVADEKSIIQVNQDLEKENLQADILILMLQ